MKDVDLLPGDYSSPQGIFVMQEKHRFSLLSVATAMQTMVAPQSIIMTSEGLHAEIQNNNQTSAVGQSTKNHRNVATLLLKKRLSRTQCPTSCRQGRIVNSRVVEQRMSACGSAGTWCSSERRGSVGDDGVIESWVLMAAVVHAA